MKKLLSLLLALAMIFSLCACSDTGDSGKDKDEDEENVEYPIMVDFEMEGRAYTLTVEEDKKVQFSVIASEFTADDLADFGVEDASAHATLMMHLKGEYTVRKGIYVASLDTCTYTMKISGKDKDAIREGIIESFEDNDFLEELEDVVNGKEVDMTEQMEYPGGIIQFELDGDTIESLISYELDSEDVDTEYTFHSNGKVKKKIEYHNGEPDYYYEYDKQGNLTDEGSMEGGSDDPTPTAPPTTIPGVQPMPTEPMPTEPSVEWQYYSVTIWVSDLIVDLTYDQIWRFNETNEYGIYIDAVVEGVSEHDAASMVIDNVWAAPDLYCFAQDQTARLVNAGALSMLTGEFSDFAWYENDFASASAAIVGGDTWAYPMTSDNGYFMYYDKSIVSDPSSLEAIIADCERNNVKFRFALENAWYAASFFFGTGCVSEWQVDRDGQFVGVYDTFCSDNGIVAVRGMQKLLNSPCYDGNADIFSDAGVVISGIWNLTAAENHFGSNLGVAALPSFKVDGYSYHLGSFHGSKLLGIKPQNDSDREFALNLLAQYLTNEECQMERYEYAGWGPSNLWAQQDPAVQSNPALSALYEQAAYAVPQGQIHGAWWDIAKLIASDVYYGMSPEQALANYQSSLENLFGYNEDVLNAWTVIGSVNGTMWDTDFKMQERADGTWRTVDQLYFEYGSEFKVRQGMSWSVNYGADGQRDGANIVCYAEGWYYVVFDPWSGYTWLE